MSTGDGTVQWVWPALEIEVPPPVGEFDAGFGPVYLNDQIVLLFSPSSYTGDLNWYCDWSDTEQGAFWTIPNPTGSPLTYTFNETTPDSTALDDVHTCHFYNLDGSIGNSQTFQYFNFPGSSRTQWQQSGSSGIPSNDGSGSSSPSSSSTSSSSSTASSSTSVSISKGPSTTGTSGSTRDTSSSTTRTGKSSGATNPPSTPSGTSSAPGASPSSDTSSSPGTSTSDAASSNDAASSSSSSPSISTGAAVGITIAAIIAVLAIAALVFFLRRRRRRSGQQGEVSTLGTEVTPLPNGTEVMGPNGAQPTAGPSMRQTEGWHGQGTGGTGGTNRGQLMEPGRSELPGV